MVLILSVALGWLWYTPTGQMQQVRWMLLNPWNSPLERVSDEDVAKAAVAFASDGRWQEALTLTQKFISSPRGKAAFLSQYTAIVARHPDSVQAQHQLERATEIAQQIDKP